VRVGVSEQVSSAAYDEALGDRGPMWDRIQSDMNQKQQKLRDLKDVADKTQVWHIS